MTRPGDLHIRIEVDLDNHMLWSHDHHDPYPPEYPDDAEHIDAFVLHQIDEAVEAHQRKHHGRSRTAAALAQFDTRLWAIEKIITEAPDGMSRQALSASLTEVIHLDSETLHDRYGYHNLGH